MKKLTYLVFVLVLSISVYAKWVENVPDAVMACILEIVHNDPQRFKGSDVTPEFVKKELHEKNELYNLKGDYDYYGIHISSDICLNILYHKKNNQVYVLNEGYNLDKISIVLDSSFGSLGNALSNNCGADYLADVFFNIYSFQFGYVGLMARIQMDKTGFEDRNIRPVNITEKQMRDACFYPEITIKNDKDWILKFPAYMLDGSIRAYEVEGELLPKSYLKVKSVKIKELYPKGSIWVSKGVG